MAFRVELELRGTADLALGTSGLLVLRTALLLLPPSVIIKGRMSTRALLDVNHGMAILPFLMTEMPCCPMPLPHTLSTLSGVHCFCHQAMRYSIHPGVFY